MTDLGESSSVSDPRPGAGIEIDGAANLRDLGGWSAAGGGRVRHGLVYRSTDLSGLTDAGLATVAGLGLATVFDLRSGAERAARPDRLPDGVADVHLDVLADMPGNPAARMAELDQMLGEPELLGQLLAGVAVTDAMADAYRGVVSLPSALVSFRVLFTSLAAARGSAVLFHCTTGKDRTGWGAAALLELLGVSREDIFDDYLLTNTQILARTGPMYATYAAHGGDPDELRPLLGVEAGYLEAAFDEMTENFGTAEGYFRDGLGLDASVIAALRAELIT